MCSVKNQSIPSIPHYLLCMHSSKGHPSHIELQKREDKEKKKQERQGLRAHFHFYFLLFLLGVGWGGGRLKCPMVHFALTNAHPLRTLTPIQLYSYDTKVLDEVQALLLPLSRLPCRFPGLCPARIEASLPLLFPPPSSWHEANCFPPSRRGQARHQDPSDRT